VRDPLTPPVVVRGPGPRWFRIGLAAIAFLYYFALVKHPPQSGVLRPIAFFTESTCLFPSSNTYRIEYRLEGWSCSDAAWEPLDPSPYFPIEADDKESRFQRVAYFYHRARENPTKQIAANNHAVLHALEDYVLSRHPGVDDAVAGALGGIRLFVADWPLPLPGEPVPRYVYQPLSPVPANVRKDLYWTRPSEVKSRCEAKGP
jgi:hypothetical protein